MSARQMTMAVNQLSLSSLFIIQLKAKARICT